jgi:hypothetical protein
MATRHERARRDRDESTCDDDRPAALAAALACARCTCAAAGNGLCVEHGRKRRVMIRHSAERAAAMYAYADRLATLAGQGRDHVLDDGDEIARPTVALREVL